MGLSDRTAVLDGTPVLFCTCRDFPHVRDQSVGVTAEGAVGSLDAVQIGKLVAVDDEVRSASNTGYAVDRKTDRLIERHPDVDKRKRDEQRVDHGSGEEAEDAALPNECRDALLQSSVRQPDFSIEP